MPNKAEQTFASLAPTQEPGVLKQKRFLIPVLSILAIVLLSVVFWLPSMVKEPSAETINPQINASPASANKLIQQSPWQDAQLGKQRRAAQDILAKLLQSQEALEQQAVEQWAEQDFQSAVDFAQSGDQLYRQQSFEQAMGQYQAALKAMEDLLGRVDDVYQQYMDLAKQNLREQKLTQAKEQATLASKLKTSLASNLDDAQKLLKRIDIADEVNDLIRKGKRFERQQDWPNAEKLYQQALQLDPESEVASEAAQRMASATTEQQYSQAMSNGYSALENKQYKTAENWFSKAQKLKLGDSSAKSALSETKTARLQASIQNHLSRAEKAAQDEDWQRSVEQYQKVQSMAPAEVSARVGLIKAKARLDIDQRFKAILEQPSTLQDQQIRRRAQELIEEASQLKSNDDNLNRQIAELKVALIKSQTPVEITLQSDGHTQVSLLRHKRLGLFSELQMDLPPGSYTLLGQRKGYRDVRINFEVELNKDIPPLEVACRELI
ncbi:MAG: hypothetical protein OIF51_08450 [Cellvibrionaceae bacterium]|nr:hypothetical protein [Cellvibrionaceae bacterium]